MVKRPRVVGIVGSKLWPHAPVEHAEDRIERIAQAIDRPLYTLRGGREHQAEDVVEVAVGNERLPHPGIYDLGLALGAAVGEFGIEECILGLTQERGE